MFDMNTLVERAFSFWPEQALFTNKSFPFYNVIKLENGDLELKLALAGYTRSDLNVEQLGTRLVISGKKVVEDSDLLYKGIMSGEFKKQFTLPLDATVQSATMKDGMLTVLITQPQAKKAVEIQVQ